MRALSGRGVTVLGGGCGGDGYEVKVRELGVHFEDLPVDKKGINPWADLRLLYKMYRWYKTEKPDAVHHFTIKPVIYGSIAARLAGVPKIVNTITGLGYVYTERGGPLRYIVDTLYRLALACASRVFFQNPDDRKLFVDTKLVADEKATLVPGSGVDLSAFKPEPRDGAGTVVLMVSRLLRDKGVVEFAHAAKAVKTVMPSSEFWLLGGVDVRNPTAVSQEEADTWQSAGWLKLLGHRDDVSAVMAKSDLVVLPSYREGAPRALIEAGAMGKALIATDVPGCREVVEHGLNGLLVPPRDHEALAVAILKLLQDRNFREAAGKASRQKMERQFDERIVIARAFEAYGLPQS